MTHSQRVPDTPWDIEIAERLQKGAALQAARDETILAWLREGDTRPLAALLLSGHVPGRDLLKLIGFMLLGPNNAKELPSALPTAIPHQLVAKRRSGQKGRSRNPERIVRDRLLAKNMDKLIHAHGMTYEDALARMIEAAEETGAAIGEKTIRNAYDASRHGKK